MVFKLAVVTCGIAMGVALTFNAALAADPSAAPTEATPAVRAAPPPRLDTTADKYLTQTCLLLASAGSQGVQTMAQRSCSMESS